MKLKEVILKGYSYRTNRVKVETSNLIIVAIGANSIFFADESFRIIKI